MRIAAILTGLVAAAMIVGSSTLVLTKDYAPILSVDVRGVPGYVYYNRDYDITIEYANRGGAVEGPVELTATLPATFFLSQHRNDPSKHGEHLSWVLDGLGSGERGSFTITVRGVLPADLSKAVYDLPGYAGHTAFVEGFSLPVSISAGGLAATDYAVADTGTATTCAPSSNCLTITKLFAPGSGSGSVEVEDGCQGTASPVSGDETLTHGDSVSYVVSSSDICNPTESSLDDGYTEDINQAGTCSDEFVLDEVFEHLSCTFYNGKNPIISVTKQYLNGSTTATADLSISCSGGTVGNLNGVGELDDEPAEVVLDEPYDGSAVCSISESNLTTGYELVSNDCASAQSVGPGGELDCTLQNTSKAKVTVEKSFVPEVVGGSAQVQLSCDGLHITVEDNYNAAYIDTAEASPGNDGADFYVWDVPDDGVECSAVETSTEDGYTADESDCEDIFVSIGDEEICGIVNKQNTLTITKYFSDGSTTATATVSVSCSSGLTATVRDGDDAVLSDGEDVVFVITGSPGTTGECSANETFSTPGYTRDGSSSDCNQLFDFDVDNTTEQSCSFTNAPNILQITKNFDPDDAGATVKVTVTCSGGAIADDDNADGDGDADSHFFGDGEVYSFYITGIDNDDACTAAESEMTEGYVLDADASTCDDSGLSFAEFAPDTVLCTLVNNLIVPTLNVAVALEGPTAPGTISATITVSCTGGASANDHDGTGNEYTFTATDNVGVFFDIEDIPEAGTECTVSQTLGGYHVVSDAFSSCDDGAISFARGGADQACDYYNKANTITITKVFDPPSAIDTAKMTIACTNGVSVFDLDVDQDGTGNEHIFSDGDTYTFGLDVGGDDTDCTITESDITGNYAYDGQQSDCALAPSFFSFRGDDGAMDVTCTITNSASTASSATFTVNKVYEPGTGAAVSVTLVCGDGSIVDPTVDDADDDTESANEGSPAVFHIDGLTAGTTCTASEASVPAGYAASGCTTPVAVTPNQQDATCTITNTKFAVFTVNKVYEPGTGAAVSVTLVCGDGMIVDPTVDDADGDTESANEGSPAVFWVKDLTSSTTCTASEAAVPTGYAASGCSSPVTVAPTQQDASCTITNTKHAVFTVHKVYEPGTGSAVSVTLSCASGAHTINDPTVDDADGDTESANEGAPAIFEIVGLTANTTCTASESPVPDGFTATGCTTAVTVTPTQQDATCTITNTRNSATFTVNKVYEPGTGVAVSVTLSCGSGSIVDPTVDDSDNDTESANEGSPAVFTIVGLSASTTCTASESPVPGGFTPSGCTVAVTVTPNQQDASCTITNTAAAPVSQAPVIDLDANDSSGATVANYNGIFVARGSSVRIADLDLSITEPDSTILRRLTIILTNPQIGDEFPSFTLPAGISRVPCAVLGQLRICLTGEASIAAYKQALDRVRFLNAQASPNATPRNITVEVADVDSNASNLAVATLSLFTPPAACGSGAWAQILIGTAENDNLSGGSGRDLIIGGGGNDRLSGGNGADCILGDAGNDSIDGGNDNDVLLGGADNDSIDGGNGNDTVQGGEGDDNVQGSTGNDTLYGNAGNDTVNGNIGTDRCSQADGGSQNPGTTTCEAAAPVILP